MPTLHWIGKEAVVKHHKDVPYRLLEPVAALSCIPSSPASPSPLAPLPQGGEGKTAPSPFKGEPAFGFPASVGAKAPNAGVKGGGEGKNTQIVDTDTSTTKNQNIENQNTENLIVQGDNLHALKALLPRYAGQVKCIYIDPPYNTGNEGWVYNDNVNSAEIKRWLGEVVGKEGETLDRHDRWLCMMYPRLLLLKQFLREDGAIFVSIDDNEVASLRLLMDEIFGAGNFVSNLIWHKKYSVSNDHKSIAPVHDFILVYSKSIAWVRNLLPRKDSNDKQYNKQDVRGIYRASDYTCNKSADERPNLYYPIINPNTQEEIWPNRSSVWRYSQERHLENERNNLIYWGKEGMGKVPAFKRYKIDLKNDGLIVPSSLWHFDDVGHTDGARKELRSILSDVLDKQDFATPKPSTLIENILKIATDKDSLILDSFAGSGTTAHAVLKQNAEDGGNRRFILVEMDENIAQNVTAERVKRVAQGYRKGKNALTPALSQEEREQSAGLLDNPRPLGEGAQSAGEGKDWVAGLGGGFQFCKLSAEPLFTAHGQIRSDVTFAQLAEFVWFVETGTGFSPSPQPSPIKGEGVISQQARSPALHNQPATNKAEEATLPSPLVGEGLGERGWTSPLLGIHQGRAIYLLYNGILKDKSVGGGNVLTQKVLDILPAHDGAKVIFAAANRLGAPKLAREQIVFKQTPYALDV